MNVKQPMPLKQSAKFGDATISAKTKVFSENVASLEVFHV
jgi:hypothetical protein